MPRRKSSARPTAAALSEEALEQLRQACWRLEHPSLAARLSSAVGTPIDVALSLLPTHWYRRVHRAAEASISKAYRTALLGVRDQQLGAHEKYFKGMVATSGAMGGLLGLPGLLIELPVTTTLMLRAIAEIAKDHGEDVHSNDTRAACLAVFALGGRTEVDDAADTGYYGVRLALSSYLSFASLKTVLDNLIHALEIPPMIVALTQSPDRLVEYAADDRHADFLATELLPFMTEHYPLIDSAAARGIMGASFGGVASLHAAWLTRPVTLPMILPSEAPPWQKDSSSVLLVPCEL